MAIAQDLLFLTDGSGAYSASGTPSASVSMAADFVSQPRSLGDFINFSVISNITGASSPQGTLSIEVSNATGMMRPTGVVFTGPVDWVPLKELRVQVGGTDAQGAPITPPFDQSLIFNRYQFARLRYVRSGGTGTFYAKLAGVED